jgi:hypothetical protein
MNTDWKHAHDVAILKLRKAQAKLAAVEGVYEGCKRTENMHSEATNIFLVSNIRRRLEKALGLTDG